MEITIQVHPHDIRDEGAEVVVRNIVQRAGIRTIIAETGTLEERHPYPKGELEHNPVHKVVQTTASFEIPGSEGWFRNLPFRPRLSQEARRGEDYIEDLRNVAPKYDVEIIPWVKALNAAFDGDVESACVRTYSGEAIRTWLCPNNPLTEIYVHRLILGILEKYPSKALLLDRLRYPDWSGATVSIERMLTCFCPHCLEKMSTKGMNIDNLRALLESFAQDPLVLQTWMQEKDKEYQLLQEWFLFRNESINDLAASIWNAIQIWRRPKQRDVKYWLNLWPPSFAPLLGQDYKALGKLCEGAKHFPYHKLGGGADLAAFVGALASGGGEEKEEQIFRELGTILRLGNLTYQEYLSEGLPVSFVRDQTKWGKQSFEKNKIFAGIQIWDIPEDEISKTIDAAIAGETDGLFLYCYGWATLSALDRVGELISKLR